MSVDTIRSSSAVSPLFQKPLVEAPVKTRKTPFAADQISSMQEEEVARAATSYNILRRLIGNFARLIPTITNLQQLQRKTEASEISQYRTLTDEKIWLNNLEGIFEISGGVVGGGLGAASGFVPQEYKAVLETLSKAAPSLSNAAVRFTDSSKIKAEGNAQIVLSATLPGAKETEKTLGDFLLREAEHLAKIQQYQFEGFKTRS